MSESPYIELALQHARQPFYEGGSKLSFGDALAQAGRLRQLAADAGISARDRVLFSSHQDEMLFITLLAGLTGAFVPVFVDADESDSAVFEAALRCQVAGAILDPERTAPPALDPARVWRVGAAPKGRLVDRLLGRKKSAGPSSLNQQLAKGPEAPVRASAPEDEAYVLCTSGSTSRPKCVAVSHLALLAHLQTLRRHFAYTPNSRVFNPLPLHHTDGLIHGTLLPFFSGARVVRPFRFEVSRTQEFVDEIYRARATHVIAVPAIYSLVETLADDLEATFGSEDVHVCISTAGPLDPGLERRWYERTGKALANVYGLTESVVAGTYNGPAPHGSKPGSVGLPVDCEVEIRDDAGVVLGPNERGELWMRGDNLTTHYIDDDELQAFTHVDGWFRTRDLAYVDEDGFCFIEGRCDNLIVCGGENVSPQEIESRLRDLDGVRQAIVYAQPDDHFGQVPHALVELEPGAHIEDVNPLIRGELTGNRLPRSVKVVPQIPMGPAGKARRQEAIAQYAAEDDSGGGPSSTDVLAVAAEVFACTPDSLTLRDGPDSIDGWDSLGHMRLVARVEKALDLRLTAAQIISIRTLRDLQSIVDAHTGG